MKPEDLRILCMYILVSSVWNAEGTTRRGAEKSLVFPIPPFSICSTPKTVFLGWVKEVRTTTS
jgi:hypothetical protein